MRVNELPSLIINPSPPGTPGLTYTPSSTRSRKSWSSEDDSFYPVVDSLDILESPLNYKNKRVLYELIGEGAHAKVYKSTWNSRLVAAKVSLCPKNQKYIEREDEVLSYISDSLEPEALHNIIGSVGILSIGGMNALILQLCECDLWTMIKHTTPCDSGPVVGLKIWKNWAQSLTSALEAIQSIGLVHGDIKPRNILIVDNVLKLADWESAFTIDQTTIPPMSIQDDGVVGTTSYSAPELLSMDSKQPTYESDIFSLGATLLAMATGEEPYSRARTSIEKIIQSQSGNPIRYITKKSRITGHVEKVIRGCCVKKEEDRCNTQTISQALEEIMV